MRSLLLIITLLMPAFSQSVVDTGSIYKAKNDTGSIAKAKNDTGSIAKAKNDTGSIANAKNDTGSIANAKNNTGSIVRTPTNTGSTYNNATILDKKSINTNGKDTTISALKAVQDSTVQNIPTKQTDSLDTIHFRGFYAGIGAGWSLGSFEAIDIWEKALPDSLGHLHLSSISLRQLSDSTSPDSLIRKGDTSSLRFTIKDKPSAYNMAFPLSISFTKFRKDDRFTTSFIFSLYSKSQKTSVYLLDDSLKRRIDLRQKFLLYSLALNLNYAKRIPKIYFSVDGIDRTDLLLGLSITPLMRMKTTNSIKRYSDDNRIIGIEDTIRSNLISTDSYGLSLSFRTGVSTVQKLSTGALEVALLYTCSWNDYFYHNGEHIRIGALNKNHENSDKPLDFVTNRFEITFSFLHRIGKEK